MKVKPADIAKEVLEAKENKTVLFGVKQVMKALKHGELSKVIYSNTLPETIEDELKHYAELKEVKVDEFVGNSAELGVVAKRAHGISMLGFFKGEKR